MVRRYEEPIEVRAEPVALLGSPRAEGAEGAPSAFIWRGRLYVVREVLGHWRERRAWWREALDPSEPDPAERPRRAARPFETVMPPTVMPTTVLPPTVLPPTVLPPTVLPPTVLPPTGQHAGRADRTSSAPGVVAVSEPPGVPPAPEHLEHEVWRVAASPGRMHATGVYDLGRGRQWRLLRVAD